MPAFLRDWLLRLTVAQNGQLEEWLDEATAPEEDLLLVLDEGYEAQLGRERPARPIKYRRPTKGGAK